MKIIDKVKTFIESFKDDSLTLEENSKDAYIMLCAKCNDNDLYDCSAVMDGETNKLVNMLKFNLINNPKFRAITYVALRLAAIHEKEQEIKDKKFVDDILSKL